MHDTLTPVCGGILGFEGPEKRLEIDFKKNPARPLGLRSFTRDQWQDMLDYAKCTIISQESNEYFDAYVLSESSLFISPQKLMVKTCGTTTLLHCIPKIMEYAQLIDLELELVMFSRKNFLFPQEQVFPHNCWEEEVSFLNRHFEGTAHVFGPITKEHWYLYIADYSDKDCGEAYDPEITMEMMMHELAPEAAQKFFKKDGVGERDKFPGMGELLPGSITDEFNFDPCGYSMNGLRDEAYWTIHVTPEEHCSYASFETNARLSSYTKLMMRVCAMFQPGKFLLALFSEGRNAAGSPGELDLTLPGYSLKHKSFTEMDNGRDLTVCTFEVNDDCPEGRTPLNAPSLIE